MIRQIHLSPRDSHVSVPRSVQREQPVVGSRMRVERPPPPSSEVTHRVMQANRGRDTRLELNLRTSLYGAKLRGYRTNYRIGRTRVDIAFPVKRVVVLIHGCFWHHCPKCNLPIPKTHREYWSNKFLVNQVRDKRVRNNLRHMGWRVVELWEHDVKKNMPVCIRRIRTALIRMN